LVRDAEAAVAAIRARGRLALLVGGTMLYAKALREGLAELPSADPALRERLARQAVRLGWPAMHARLDEVDPETAQRLDPGDSQRIQRALEVYELTGMPMSRLLRQGPKPGQGEGQGKGQGLRIHTIALLPADRTALHRRIELRFDAMLAAGFLDEVRALRARPDLHDALPSMRSVGYRQAWAHLQQHTTVDLFRSAAIAASRQLAKRQMTWLRSIPQAQPIDPFEADAVEQISAAVSAGVAARGAPAPASR
jgi:tRNA dimethylallyltransferase